MGAVPEVRASVIDASSRFTSVAASVIRMHLDEIAVLLTKRKRLNAQIADACNRARAMNLSPKLVRQAVQLRGKEQADHHTDIELLELYKAADGWYGADAGVPSVQITLTEPTEKLRSFMEIVRLFIDEIAGLLDEKRALSKQIRRADKNAREINLSPKVLREVVLLRSGDKEEFLKEKTLQALYRAADGWDVKSWAEKKS